MHWLLCAPLGRAFRHLDQRPHGYYWSAQRTPRGDPFARTPFRCIWETLAALSFAESGSTRIAVACFLSPNVVQPNLRRRNSTLCDSLPRSRALCAPRRARSISAARCQPRMLEIRGSRCLTGRVPTFSSGATLFVLVHQTKTAMAPSGKTRGQSTDTPVHPWRLTAASAGRSREVVSKVGAAASDARCGHAAYVSLLDTLGAGVEQGAKMRRTRQTTRTSAIFFHSNHTMHCEQYHGIVLLCLYILTLSGRTKGLARTPAASVWPSRFAAADEETSNVACAQPCSCAREPWSIQFLRTLGCTEPLGTAIC
ncbi:hypothetical protein C8Q73DRAFT_349875 [Cubamyces lactineus]|nr:hypothetical protein C8Q73DRAFT_349875 [Cubamyces lactineus]